jgi:hypothetical protein
MQLHIAKRPSNGTTTTISEKNPRFIQKSSTLDKEKTTIKQNKIAPTSKSSTPQQTNSPAQPHPQKRYLPGDIRYKSQEIPIMKKTISAPKSNSMSANPHPQKNKEK